MPNLGALFSDDYNFETLVVPASALALPLAVSVTTLGFKLSSLTGLSILGLEVLAYPVWLTSNSIRSAGKLKESSLFPTGMATTKMLRLHEGDSDYSKSSRRQLVEKVSGIKLPGLSAEKRNPLEADQKIKDAVDTCKERMRDKTDFLLLRRELKAYGFWRNMYGIKSYGLAVCLLSIVVALLAIISSKNTTSANVVAPIASIIVSLLVSAYWLMGVTSSQVIRASTQYAEQFFKSLKSLSQ